MAIHDYGPVAAALPQVTVDWALEFVHRGPRLALEYWKSRCGDRKMPTRVDLSPFGMSGFLQYVGLIEVLQLSGAKYDYRVRLAGTHIEQVFGSITGRYIGSVLPPQIEERWRKYFDIACESEQPLRLSGRVGFEDKTWLDSEALLAPLGDEGRPASMLFAAFASWPEKN